MFLYLVEGFMTSWITTFVESSYLLYSNLLKALRRKFLMNIWQTRLFIEQDWGEYLMKLLKNVYSFPQHWLCYRIFNMKHILIFLYPVLKSVDEKRLLRYYY